VNNTHGISVHYTSRWLLPLALSISQQPIPGHDTHTQKVKTETNDRTNTITRLELNPALLPFIKDKVVVFIGSATGISRSAIEKFFAHGAKVVFGDLNDSAAQALVSQVGSENALYAHCNTASYADQLSHSDAAKRQFGRVDIAVGNASVVITPNPYAVDSDVLREPPMGEVDGNLEGTIFTSRIAAHYLRR
jgi:hypothetical protein